MARWEVAIPAHIVGRHEVPEQTRIAAGEDEAGAKASAVRYAHIDAGVPKWRPYLRETFILAVATPYVGDHEREQARVRAGRRR